MSVQTIDKNGKYDFENDNLAKIIKNINQKLKNQCLLEACCDEPYVTKKQKEIDNDIYDIVWIKNKREIPKLVTILKNYNINCYMVTDKKVYGIAIQRKDGMNDE